MTSSEGKLSAKSARTTQIEASLLAEGWKREFVTEEPRLSEAVQIYEELGCEVRLVPVPPDDSICTACMKENPDRYKIIFTRKIAEGKGPIETKSSSDALGRKAMGPDNALIRVMRTEDIPVIVEIDAMASGTPRGEYLKAKALQALDTKHGMVISLVAEVDKQVVGFLMGEVYSGEFGIPEAVATVDTVGIHPKTQHKGIGKLLMSEFFAHTRKAGVERVRTIVAWNQWELMGYFRAAGFAPGTCIVLERST